MHRVFDPLTVLKPCTWESAKFRDFLKIMLEVACTIMMQFNLIVTMIPPPVIAVNIEIIILASLWHKLCEYSWQRRKRTSGGSKMGSGTQITKRSGNIGTGKDKP